MILYGLVPIFVSTTKLPTVVGQSNHIYKCMYADITPAIPARYPLIPHLIN